LLDGEDDRAGKVVEQMADQFARGKDLDAGIGERPGCGSP